jgi:formate dehydrogenase major subunit
VAKPGAARCQEAGAHEHDARQQAAILQDHGTALGASTVTALGFLAGPGGGQRPAIQAGAHDRDAQHLPYCSVACGVIMYSQGDNAKNTKSVDHPYRGDPDHP